MDMHLEANAPPFPCSVIQASQLEEAMYAMKDQEKATDSYKKAIDVELSRKDQLFNVGFARGKQFSAVTPGALGCI